MTALEQKIEKAVALLRRGEKLALRLDPADGYWLAFSGGKDSQCIYHLAEMAGVRFRAHMSLTTVDPPEVLRFVRDHYPGVELLRPRKGMFALALQKGMLPTRARRWCCAELKERGGAGKVTVIGVRRQESARRARRGELELPRHGFSGNFDDYETARAESRVACVGGKDKLIISPILDWTERDVWQFLDGVAHVPHCPLYDRGHRRIGCVLCPMEGYRDKLRDIRDFPGIAKAWMLAIRRLHGGKWRGRPQLPSPELSFRWWLSGKSLRRFVADEVLQGSLFPAPDIISRLSEELDKQQKTEQT